ncbi:hypothetical protein FHX49_001092 [Microbacterium endophyticum]|uniref:Stress-response A/B barrel domain-containing protein n=1 Tax=Microbacterium endophyticum TaxID=1526412 RepID=A0A7W4V282_9MICO|nr:Dabb family protein [Microbacterium endophyticum]MBB2975526.1 hypothetical protein [Microbacterium endophyticum]NIK35455.1 hypothetical protein [Microbacterium endophyticum]
MPYRHIVLFDVYKDVPEERLAHALHTLRGLAVLPGVSSWRIEMSLDERKGRVVVEDSTFVDQESFIAFRDCAEHRAAAEEMSHIADWRIGDYVIE